MYQRFKDREFVEVVGRVATGVLRVFFQDTNKIQEKECEKPRGSGNGPIAKLLVNANQQFACKSTFRTALLDTRDEAPHQRGAQCQAMQLHAAPRDPRAPDEGRTTHVTVGRAAGR